MARISEHVLAGPLSSRPLGVLGQPTRAILQGIPLNLCYRGTQSGSCFRDPNNAKVAAGLILAAGAQGNVSTETLNALTEAEFKKVVARLP